MNLVALSMHFVTPCTHLCVHWLAWRSVLLSLSSLAVAAILFGEVENLLGQHLRLPSCSFVSYPFLLETRRYTSCYSGQHSCFCTSDFVGGWRCGFCLLAGGYFSNASELWLYCCHTYQNIVEFFLCLFVFLSVCMSVCLSICRSSSSLYVWFKSLLQQLEAWVKTLHPFCSPIPLLIVLALVCLVLSAYLLQP